MKNLFRLTTAKDPVRLQYLVALRLLGVDVSLLLCGCLLDWSLAFQLNLFNLRYPLTVSLGPLVASIGRNDALYR